ncbi:MAG TPA: hypothetical protein VFX59_31210 [Polyangiales bacterium]|nr:hypothetical protein [Polyangiales bacterium]
MNIRSLGLSVLLGSVACTGDTGTETDRPGCSETVSERSLTADEQTAVGTPAQWAQRGHSLPTATLRFRDGTGAASKTSGLSLKLDLEPANARLRQRRDAESPQVICPDVLDVPATLALHSDDGAFDESFTATARIEGSQLSFRSSVLVSALRGSYRPVGFDAKFTELHVQAFVGEASSQGSLMLEAPASIASTSADVGDW